MTLRRHAWLVSLPLLLIAAQLDAQRVSCELHRGGGDTIQGECVPDQADDVPLPAASIRLYPVGEEGTDWVGSLTVDDRTFDVSVTTYEYWSGLVRIVTTPFGWFIPDTLDLQDEPPRLVWNLEDEAPPSSTDLIILTRARNLLSDESVWDRDDDRECAPSDSTYSLYCSLAEATRQVTGEDRHRQPALQVVRRVVQDKWSERIENHRLMDFNNDPATSYEDLIQTFEIARERILNALR